MGKVVRAIVGAGLVVVGAVTGSFQLILAGVSLVGGALLQPSLNRNRAAAAAQLQLGEQPRQAIFGRAAVGGSLVDAFNYGGKYGTDWEVLVIALADHRCDALEGFFVDDAYVAFAGDGNVAGFNNQLQVFWRDGQWDQTVPSILTANGPGWTANDRGRGVAYVVVAYKADKSDAKNPVWPSGRPRFRWVVRGLRCYQPRKDSTVGGSGAHRRDNPATWEWTENPIDIRYNWVRGIYAGDLVDQPGMLLLGRGLSAIEAPPANVFSRANLCDELVGGQPRYRVGGVVAANEPFIDVESDFAAAVAGTISQPQGAVEVDPGQAKAPVAHFTDDDLLIGSTVRWNEGILGAANEGWVNTVAPRFIDPAQRWTVRSAPVQRDLADVTADGGPREQQPQLDFVTDGAQAQRIGQIIRRLGRLWGRATVTLPPRFAFIEEGDWVTWQSHRRFGGATLTFRVEAWGSDKAWHHTLTLRQISASVYSDTAPLDDGSIASNQVPPPVVAAPGAAAWNVTAVLLGSGSVRIPNLRISGAVDDPAASFVVFEYIQQVAAPGVGSIWTIAASSRPEVSLLDIPVPEGGTFWVAISYVVDGIQGERRVLGPIATSGLSFSDGSPVAPTAPANANRVPFSRMEGDQGWAVLYNPVPLSIATEYGVSGAGTRFFQGSATASAASQQFSIGNAERTAVKVTPGERLSVQARVSRQGTAAGTWQLELWTYQADGVTGSGTVIASGTGLTSLGDGIQRGFVTVPSGRYFARLELRFISTAAGTAQIAIAEPMVTEAAPGQSVHPSFSPGPNAVDGADVTGENVAAAITGQGPGATAPGSEVLNVFTQRTQSYRTVNGTATMSVRGTTIWRASGGYGDTTMIQSAEAGPAITVSGTIYTGAAQMYFGIRKLGENTGAALADFFVNGNQGHLQARLRGTAVYQELNTGVVDGRRIGVSYNGSQAIWFIDGVEVARRTVAAADQGATVCMSMNSNYSAGASPGSNAASVMHDTSYVVGGATNVWSQIDGVGRPADNATSAQPILIFGSAFLEGNNFRMTVHDNGTNHYVYTDTLTGGCKASFIQADGTGNSAMRLVRSSDNAFASAELRSTQLVTQVPGSNAVSYTVTRAAGDRVVVTYDGQNYRFYYNGTLMRTAEATEKNAAHYARWHVSYNALAAPLFSLRALEFLPFTQNSFEGLGNLNLTVNDYRTSLGTAAAITGQGPWATTTIPTSRVSNLDNSGNLSSLANVTTRNLSQLNNRAWTNLFRADGTTAITDADAITSLGTAAAITGQGALATKNNVDLAGSTVTGTLPVSKADTALRNSTITIDGSGILTGIGTANVPVSNTQVALSGTAAARPASGAFTGQLYTATDTRVVSRWSGSAWEDVATRNTGALADLNAVDLAGSTVTGTLPVSKADTALRNSTITIDGSGILTGIGTANVPVANTQVALSGTAAARPASGAFTGQLYAATDRDEVYRWNGSSWLTTADVTASAQRSIVPQFPIIEVRQGNAGHTGTRDITHEARRGTAALNGGTWSLPAQNLGAGTATIASGTGVVTLSGIVQSGSYTVRYTHTDGVATDLPVNVTYVPASASGGSSSSGSSSISSFSSSSYTVVTNEIAITLPSGVTSAQLSAANVQLDLAAEAPTGSTTVQMIWQRESSPGTWVDVGSAATSSPNPSVSLDAEGYHDALPGAITCNATVTGLAAGSAQKFRLRARVSAGNVRLVIPAGAANVTS